MQLLECTEVKIVLEVEAFPSKMNPVTLRRDSTLSLDKIV